MKIKKIINLIKKENINIDKYIDLREEINDDFIYYSLFEHVYEKSHNIKEYNRESTGAIYTPKEIVELMINKSIKKLECNLWDSKILEPSSGSGNFVQLLFEKLLKEIKNKYPQKTELEIKKYIADNIIYISELNPYALITTIYRIYDLYGVILKNTYLGNSLLFNYLKLINIENNSYYQLEKITVNLFNDLKNNLENIKEVITKKEPCNFTQFDLVIGNPPYGNLLDKKFKSHIHDNYSNIALNFFDTGSKLLKEKGVLCYIAPHSFTRSNSNSKWRKEIFEKKYLNELIDCGNPFYDITLETVIYIFKKDNNKKVKLSSLKDKSFQYLADYEKVFKKDSYRFILYYDKNYEKIQNLSNLTYPFNGKRGHDLSKKELEETKAKNNLWFILGKNISKNGLININNYDKYINLNNIKENKIINQETLAITQFGTNLKAAILNEDCYPSGGVVLISHDNLTIKEAKDYLNSEHINYYLKRYILNNADLTVHLDGVYLKEIPYKIEENYK